MLPVAACLWLSTAALAETPLRGPDRGAPLETLEGRFEQLVSDDFDSGTSKILPALVTDRGEHIALQGREPLPPEWRVGDRIQVKGRTVPGAFEVVSQARVAVEERLQALESWTTGPKKILLIRFNWVNDTAQPYTTAQAQSTMFGAAGSVAAFYAEGSYGVTTHTGSITPWLTVSTNKPTTCDPFTGSNEAYTKAKAAGYDPATFDFYVFVFPSLPCGWSGLASVGSTGVWINQSLSTYVVSHELGHNYGLLHAHSLRCPSGVFSPSCTRSEYGDPFDTMGGGLHQFGSYAKNLLAWLTGPSVTSVSSGNTNLTLQALEAGSGLRGISLPTDAGRTYWLELRQAIGFDANLSGNANVMNGALVHIGPSYNYDFGTDLLDMTPFTATFNDAALDVGQQFTDLEASLRVTTIAKVGSTLSVNIQYRIGPPTAKFAYFPNPATTQQNVFFTNSSSGLPTSYLWDFGDGAISTLQSPTHAYATAGTYTVTLTVGNGIAYNAVSHPVTVSGAGAAGPYVSSISPPSGATTGQTFVTIRGANFNSAATVQIGGVAATSVTFVDATTLTAVSPAHAAGPVNVAVTNPGPQTATLTNGFAYTATGPRTFASAIAGNDANPCSSAQPCRTLSRALELVSPDGEVTLLDSGGYGTVTVSQSVTIQAPPGIYAGITAPSGDAVTVAASPADTVRLRGLTIHGAGGVNGIRFVSGGSLTVEDCSLDGLGSGIRAEGPGDLEVLRTSVRGSSIAGIAIAPPSPTHVVLESCRIEGNAAGVSVTGGALVSLLNSVASGNTGTAVSCDAGEVSVIDGLFVGNGTGLAVSGTGTVRVDDATIADNGTGLAQSGGGTLLSRTSNTVEGNGLDTAGTVATYSAK
jgi:PKD repeat protein